jgi:hypothetical protein
MTSMKGFDLNINIRDCNNGVGGEKSSALEFST